MNKLGNRIKLARETHPGGKMSQVELAKVAGISQTTVADIERGRNKGTTRLVDIARALNVSISWLNSGKGEMRPSEKRRGHQDHINIVPAEIGNRKIPLISYVQAGNWTEATDSYHPGDAHDWLLTNLELSDSAFALEVKGDSMLPEFKPGDQVIIDPAVTPRPGDFVVAKNGEEEATFKKFRPRGRNEKGEQVIELVPLNPDYESLRSDITPFVIIGTMVEFRRYRK